MTLKQIIEAENSFSKVIDELKKSIVTEIEETAVEGVKKVSSTITIVNFFTLAKESIWAPGYYNSSAQAHCVAESLKSASTAVSCTKKLQEMIDKKSVILKGTKYPLNEQTIEILRKYIK